MNRWRSLVHILQLLRVEQPLAAVGNAWLVVFLAFGLEHEGGRSADLADRPLPHALALAAILSVGLVGYGLALNDLLDIRHDLKFTPSRPLPAGRVGRRAAVSTCLLCLLAALGAATLLGKTAVFLCLAAAAGALFYNVTGRFLPAVGIILLGLVHATHMFILNPAMTFAWPIWLTMTHVIGVAIATHIVDGKRPRLRANDWWIIACAWAFWTLALVGWMTWARNADAAPVLIDQRPLQWLAPAAVAVVFIVLAGRALRGSLESPRTRRAAVARLAQLSALSTIFYSVAWLAGLQMFREAGVLLGLFALAVVAVRVVAALARWLALKPADYRVQPGQP